MTAASLAQKEIRRLQVHEAVVDLDGELGAAGAGADHRVGEVAAGQPPDAADS
jgi:hypothetical protein